MKCVWYFIKVLIQCTWGCIQNLIGIVVCLIHIKKKHYFYRGNIVTKWNTLSGMSLGMFIFTADDNNDDLIPYAGGTKQELIAYASRITVHEYGHTIQSMLLGPFMLIPGIISVVWGSMKRYERLRNEYGVPYTFCWVESWASRLGEKYTGKMAIW